MTQDKKGICPVDISKNYIYYILVFLNDNLGSKIPLFSQNKCTVFFLVKLPCRSLKLAAMCFVKHDRSLSTSMT